MGYVDEMRKRRAKDYEARQQAATAKTAPHQQPEPTSLPATINKAHARLPETYEAAKTALATCTRIDECQDWADKALALASYARQADDDTLVNHARRIQARAVRRVGELLRQLDGRGQHRKRDGAVLSSISQRAAASAAGIGERQRKTAVNVANVPVEQFDAAVDSDAPPTVTELAAMGRHPRDIVGDRPPASFAIATRFLGDVERLADLCAAHDPEVVAEGLNERERVQIRNHLQAISVWAGHFSAHVQGGAS